jgi:exodeoxyribonuclease V gamma subunit
VAEVRVADRIEVLLDELVAILRVPPADPFTADWVAVPSIGMRRWVEQQLSTQLGTGERSTDGVAANITLPFPGGLRDAVLRADAERRGSDEDPWAADRLNWEITAELLAARSAGDAVLRPVAHLPEGATVTGRATAIADLFDRYAVHRPSMLRCWWAGKDVDPSGDELRPDRCWQPALWRRLRARLGESPAERWDTVLADVAAGDLRPDLPDRLVLFGLSTLPPSTTALLRALGHHREIHALLLSPSIAVTLGAVAFGADLGAEEQLVATRAHHSTVELAHHSLLRSWGTPSRETGVALGANGLHPQVVPSSPAVPATLLGHLQDAIRNDRRPDGSVPVDPADDSIQIHVCTGLTRQVEVLRDAVLHLLRRNPDLSERDVVILTPDVASVAPLVEAVLGPSADTPVERAGGAPALRYRIIDRGARADVPLLAALVALLELVPGRFTASAVIDFLSSDPVRAQFGLTPEDLDQLEVWRDSTGVRWGAGSEDRARFGLDTVVGTWEDALDRVLIGCVVRPDAETLVVGRVAPVDVGDSAVGGAGRVADAVRELIDVRQDLLGDRSVAEWCLAVSDAADRLLAAPGAASWQRSRLDAVLGEIRAQSESASVADAVVSLADMARVLQDRFAGAGSPARLGTGAITVGPLSPLRSVPHRVVCLLGLDQDAMPRGLQGGDDLLLAAPAIGDRDVRAEQRQLLLEALLAARDHLVITCGGADVRTGAPIPRAVVLDEFLDELVETSGAVRDDGSRVVTEHPRHAFDRRNFGAEGFRDGAALSPVRAADGAPWCFDSIAIAGAAVAGAAPAATGVETLVRSPLPELDLAELELSTFRDFFEHPVRWFAKERLGLWVPRSTESPDDEIPVAADGSAKWALGDALLRGVLDRKDLDAMLDVVDQSGALPPGVVGEELADQLHGEVTGFIDVLDSLDLPLRNDDRVNVDVSVGGVRIRGTVEICGSADQPGPATCTFTRPRPSHRLCAAIDALVLTVARPDTHWRSTVIARGDTPVITSVSVRGDDPDQRRERAASALGELLRWYRTGTCLPLPYFPRTSGALGTAEKDAAVRDAWEGRFGERDDPAVLALFGGPTTYDDMADADLGGLSMIDVARAIWDVVEAAVVDLEADR